MVKTKSKIFAMLLVMLFVVSAFCLVGCNSSAKAQTFIFKSDYCTLNNEGSYANGKQVNLTLKVKDDYSSYYVAPEDVSVLIGNKEAVKGSDYTYTINEDKTATLTLSVSDNVVITAMRKDSNNVFRVGASEYEKAVNFEGENYVQTDYVYTRYTGSFMQTVELINYFSPTVNYQDYIDLLIFGSSGDRHEEIKYYHNLNDHLDIYTYNKDNKNWDKTQSDDMTDFKKPKDLFVIKLISNMGITYKDYLEQNFDKTKNAYCFKVVQNDVVYEATMQFRDNKLTKITYYYYDETNNCGEYGSSTFTYNVITPELPTNIAGE